VNIDDCPDVIKKYEIVSIPTILFIKNGELISKTVGMTSKEKIENDIKKAFG
ncbi:MAG: thioredoxin family protein, partial [Clostridiales bacterium]|nr:thioredoxin family protein [Clostridiales bacterium]